VRVVNGAAVQVDGDRLRLKARETMFPAAELRLGGAAASWAKRL
jgi:hypothetical protein